MVEPVDLTAAGRPVRRPGIRPHRSRALAIQGRKREAQRPKVWHFNCCDCGGGRRGLKLPNDVRGFQCPPQEEWKHSIAPRRDTDKVGGYVCSSEFIWY